MIDAADGRQGAFVAVLAGRRIDASGDEPKRFPIENIAAVRVSLRTLFEREKTQVLVSSAACGADLLALDIALHLGLRCHVVLPFSPETFRNTSVIDRPGDWGSLYDSVIATVSANGTLVVLDSRTGEESAYDAATRRIIRDALEIAAPRLPLAVVVWEGEPRQDSDATAKFQRLARSEGMSERTISTC